jgi:hypothetical protein
MQKTYTIGRWTTWFLIFIGSWTYFVVTFGCVKGLLFGWFAAGIIATALCWLWPLYLIGGIGIALFYLTPLGGNT